MIQVDVFIGVCKLECGGVCNVKFIFGYCMDIEVCIIMFELKYALSINCVDIKFIIFHDGSI